MIRYVSFINISEIFTLSGHKQVFSFLNKKKKLKYDYKKNLKNISSHRQSNTKYSLIEGLNSINIYASTNKVNTSFKVIKSGLSIYTLLQTDVAQNLFNLYQKQKFQEMITVTLEYLHSSPYRA